MSGNYSQLKSKADAVIDATENLRTASVEAELSTKEYEQAELNAARTEAEYIRRKDQSDSAEEDRDAIVARIAELRSQRTSLQTQWNTLHPSVKLTTPGPTAAPVAAGEFYVNTVTKEAYEWDGSAWGASLGPVNAALALAGVNGKIQAAAGAPTFKTSTTAATPAGNTDGELYVNSDNGNVYEWNATALDWTGVIGNVFSKQAVVGLVGKISADTSGPGTTYDGTEVIAVEAKKGLIDTKRGEIDLLEREAKLHRDQIETQNLLIVTKRAEEEQLEAEVASLKALIAELKSQRDSYPPTHTQYAALDGQITIQEGILSTEETNLTNVRAEITTAQSTITSQTTLLNEDVAKVTAAITALRNAERDLAAAQVTLDTKVSDFTEVANKLQDIDGTDSGRTVTAYSTEADGETGSQLKVLVTIEGSLGTVNTTYNTIETAAKDARDAAAADVAPAKNDLNAKKSTLSLAQTTLDTLSSDLRVLVDKQKDIEVTAAASLLEDFLKNENAVLASAPTVSLATQTEISKTCPSSKVNELVSKFRAAYADEDEYKALLAQIIENPFAVFFNQIEDPCFVLLTEAEVAEFRAEVESRFRAEAQRLLRQYGKSGSGSGSGIRTTTLVLVALVVLLIVAAFVYLN